MISIVVPCYNCEDTLERCMESIWAQNGHDFEVILVDDGSTDRTGILCDVQQSNHKNVIVVHQKNGGLVNAWKNGVSAARGEYIVFVDSDDWVEPNLIGTVEQAVLQNGYPDIILYGMQIECADGRRIKKEYPLAQRRFSKEEIHAEILPHFFCQGKMESPLILSSRCSKAFKRNLLLEQMDCISVDIKIGEDTLTSFVAVLEGDSIYNIKEFYPYHYCRHNDSMLGNYSINTIHQFVRIRNELYREAKKRKYIYICQIENYFLDNVLITIKKMIANTGKTRREIRTDLEKIDEITEVRECFLNSYKIVKGYSLQHKIFLNLVRNRCWTILILLTKLIA